MSSARSFLDIFLEGATSSEASSLIAVECDNDTWTYAELDEISDGIAKHIRVHFGDKPLVAVLSENHPYMIALMLAVWKLGGIYAPIDPNVPNDLMGAMLQNIGPTVVVYPSGNKRLSTAISDLSMKSLIFDVTTSTMPSLFTQYPWDGEPVSANISMDEPCLYLYTSSATALDNLKCVPLTHRTLAANAARQHELLCQNSEMSFNNLRVLGWCPFTHIMAYTNDIGPWTFMTRGSYIFSSRPPNYGLNPNGDSSGDSASRLVQKMLDSQPNMFACVPSILMELMIKWNEGELRSELSIVLPRFKMFITGGAKLEKDCILWARERGLRLYTGIGMTEFSGGAFHELANLTAAWSPDCLIIPEASFVLLDDEGQPADIGEFVITSKYIARGYLNRESDSFSFGPDGAVTFSTGDIYEYDAQGKLIWVAKKENVIQLISGDKLDPTPIEHSLKELTFVRNAVVVGNRFLDGPSQHTCAIVELAPDRDTPKCLRELTRCIGRLNSTLPPSLRITWSRVLILKDDQSFPLNRKGVILRKNLQALYGDILTELLTANPESFSNPAFQLSVHHGLRTQHVEQAIIDAVTGAVGIQKEIFLSHLTSTFSELGMNSIAAVAIANRLNETFALDLPPNICHVYIDLLTLVQYLLEVLKIPSLSNPLTPSEIGTSPGTKDNIVVVGQMLRLPGEMNSPELFWQGLMLRRTDVITEPPYDRWDHDSFYKPLDSLDPQQPGDIYFKKAGFINITDYDSQFFSISPAEAVFVSPSNRLALEAAYEALENANIPLSQIKGTDMGIFVAAGADDGYGALLMKERGFDVFTRFWGAGISSSTSSGRLSYLLDVHGPSITYNTACSGGLVALDAAVQYLHSSNADCALVLSANTHSWPGEYSFLCANRMSSPNSRCATFTDMADGYVPSEGVVAFVLKKERSAMRDGDNILGQIMSTSTRHNGRSQGLAAPNREAQVALQRDVISQAGLQPSDISFVEAHGTGTSLGDLMEIQGLNTTFQTSTIRPHPLIVGAAKSCVGHTEPACGLVALAKGLLTLKHGVVPGITHLTKGNLNPSVDLSIVPLRISDEPIILHESEKHYGMILAYGFAGSIAATIVKSPPQAPSLPGSPCGSSLFTVSAKSQAALDQYLHDYDGFCRDVPNELFQSICYTSCVGREHYRFRFSCLVSTIDELRQQLQHRLRVPNTTIDNTPSPRLVFAFPGQGLQYRAMAHDLCTFPVFRAILHKAALVAENIVTWPWIFAYLANTDTSMNYPQSEVYAQLCCFVYQYSVASWLIDLGLDPACVVGHSLGEVAASVIAGILSYDVAVTLVAVREKALQPIGTTSGAMAAIALEYTRIDDLLKTWKIDVLAIAVYNGPRSHVVSGPSEQIDQFVGLAKSAGFRVTKLTVNQGFHSACVEPGLPSIADWCTQHAQLVQLPSKDYVSSTYGQSLDSMPPHYWVDHARQPVRLDKAIASIVNSGPALVLDIGPQPAIWTVLQDSNLKGSPVVATTAKQGGNQYDAFLSALSLLYHHGVTINFAQLFKGVRGLPKKILLPTYPFQRRRHYPSIRFSRTPKSSRNTPHRPAHFIVDPSLHSLLVDHMINHERILPAVAILDLVSNTYPGQLIKIVNFHLPFQVPTPGVSLTLSRDHSNSFLVVDDRNGDNICSGTLTSNMRVGQPTQSIQVPNSEETPLQVLGQNEIYSRLASVTFGPQFRNAAKLIIWDTHADVSIHLSDIPASDTNSRIQILDPVLHALGAVMNFIYSDRIPSEIAGHSGIFLPTSLQDFAFHSLKLPSSIICRYYLPVEFSRNFHHATVRFDVFSESRELIASCQKYSIAFFPLRLLSRDPTVETKEPLHLSYQWRETPIQDTSSIAHVDPSNRILYLGSTANTLPYELTGHSNQNRSIFFTRDETFLTALEAALTIHEDRSVFVILDITEVNMQENETTINQTLLFLQILLKRKVSITKLLVFSTLAMSLPPSFLSDDGTPSIIQGIMRVFGTEAGLAGSVRLVDLPELSTISPEVRHHIISQELEIPSLDKYSTSVAWRSSSQGPLRISRYTCILSHAPLVSALPERVIEGVIIIAGMGSIGKSIASQLVKSSKRARIVFLGRRHRRDPTVDKSLSSFDNNISQIHYLQCDICDEDQVRTSLSSVESMFGPISSIFHTAAVVHDALIESLATETLSMMLDPKVKGAWNLHVSSVELGYKLSAFVVLSSASVPFSNAGQAVYVGANSFLDWLAAYRKSIGLPAVSLQLGPWESEMLQAHASHVSENTPLPVTGNGHGIPLILKATATCSHPDSPPIQFIGRVNLEQLARIPAYRRDTIFEEIFRDFQEKAVGSVDVQETVLEALREVLQLDNDEDSFDLSQSLLANGVDSISFAHVRAQVLEKAGVTLPVKFLSEGYSIRDMIASVS